MTDHTFTYQNTWHVIESYLRENKILNRHQLQSYNYFIDVYLNEITKQYNPITMSFTNPKKIVMQEEKTYKLMICFENPRMTKPKIYENNGSTQLMYPNIARLRNFTYSAPIFVDVVIHTVETDVKTQKQTQHINTIKEVNFGKIPIMLRSKCCILSEKHHLFNQEECENDLGGYFIINGQEKVIVSQERTAENRVYVFPINKKQKYQQVAEIKSVSHDKFGIVRTAQVKLTVESSQKNSTIKILIPHVKHDIPIFIFFRALGVTSDLDIINCLLLDIDVTKHKNIQAIIKDSLDETSALKVYNKEDAMVYLSKYISAYYFNGNTDISKKIAYLHTIIKKEYLPHIYEKTKDYKKKILFTGHMVSKMLKVHAGLLNYDDRDSYINKRVETPGVLMANLYKMLLNKLVKDIKNCVNKEFQNGSWIATKDFSKIITKMNIYKVIKSINIIETGFKYALSTGNWGAQKVSKRNGIAQVLSRLSYNSTLSHIRRVVTPMEKNGGKLIAPRKLHPTQVFVMCPAETPEGHQVGVVKNLALSAQITNGCSAEPVKKILENCEIIDIEDLDITTLSKNMCRIFLNGDWIFMLQENRNPNDLVNFLKECRMNGLINLYISISWNINENSIYINTDGGRCIRPLYKVKNNKLLITDYIVDLLKQRKISWNNLLNGGLSHKYNIPTVIDLIDVEELNNNLVAMNIKKLHKTISKQKRMLPYTYCEIHPSLMLGVLASAIPFCDHNQSPRNTYQSAMGKQAMGIYAMNFNNRMDTLAHSLYYPQQPIVNNNLMRLLPSNNMPSGCNVIVAIMSHTGYNQEDSVLFNQSSIDFGLFLSTFYRTYKNDESRQNMCGNDSEFTKPDKTDTKEMKYANYSKLTEEGFVQKNQHVKGGDIIIGKVMPLKDPVVVESKDGTKRVYTKKDSSTIARSNEEGFVDGNPFVSKNSDGYRFCKVRLRSIRKPNIGDKFSSRHGQKGTIGMKFRKHDMPFTKDGIVPDIIVNPHAIPSRMTIGQLIECITGKASTIMGKYGDGTPFTGQNKVQKIGNILQNECGFHSHGNEVMYNPQTGEQLKVSIFIGPTYYQRLKHMVDDKIHSRATGPRVSLTRQATEGRARDGGLRFGEMERDCMIAHGATTFLKETFLERSDNYKIHTCNKCGGIASVNKKKGIYHCKYCNNYSNFSELRIPYAYKLFYQEMESMSIGAKFRV